MKRQWHTASVHDWLFCRLYSYFHRVDEGTDPYHWRPQLRGWLRPLMETAVLAGGFAAVAFLLPEESSLRQAARWLAAAIVLLFLVRAASAPIRYAVHNERRTRYPAEGSGEVRYACVDEKGIRINWLNGGEEQESEEPFIRWAGVRSIQLILTEHPRRVQQRTPAGDYMKSAMRQFAQVKARYPGFPYQPERIYEDRLSLLIAHEPAFLTQLPLPPAWSGEQLRRFLAEVSDASGKPIMSYTYGRDERDAAYRLLLEKHQITL
jgi:hypothetical protein